MAPELNRNSNIGEVGANMNKSMFRRFLRAMAWATQARAARRQLWSGGAPRLVLLSSAGQLCRHADKCWGRSYCIWARSLCAQDRQETEAGEPRAEQPRSAGTHCLHSALQ